MNPADGFKEAALRCIRRFADDNTHRGGKTPIMHGPCDECCDEVVQELMDEHPSLPGPGRPVPGKR